MLTVEADMTIFALFSCAFALIEIATDPLAGREGFGGYICGGLRDLTYSHFTHQ